jgi:hypothetical protein
MDMCMGMGMCMCMCMCMCMGMGMGMCVRFALRADEPSVTCEVARTTSHPTEADAHHFRIVAVMAT